MSAILSLVVPHFASVIPDHVWQDIRKFAVARDGDDVTLARSETDVVTQ
jgi:hypothetical protein